MFNLNDIDASEHTKLKKKSEERNYIAVYHLRVTMKSSMTITHISEYISTPPPPPNSRG